MRPRIAVLVLLLCPVAITGCENVSPAVRQAGMASSVPDDATATVAPGQHEAMQDVKVVIEAGTHSYCKAEGVLVNQNKSRAVNVTVDVQSRDEDTALYGTVWKLHAYHVAAGERKQIGCSQPQGNYEAHYRIVGAAYAEK